MTVLAAEALPAAEGGGAAAAGAGAAAGSGGGLPMPGMPEPPGGSVAFAIAILLIGFACIGLWVAFHNPDNAETGGFPGLFGQMLQWVHKGEEAQGAQGPASAGSGGIPSGLSGILSEGGLFGALPASIQKKLVDIAAGTGLVQWLKEHL